VCSHPPLPAVAVAALCYVGALRCAVLCCAVLCCVLQAVVFTRDSGSGRVSIDREGRPVITYWPCDVTRQHMVEVRRWLTTVLTPLVEASCRR
jgi:hypothetical protein